jgi:3-hydroxyacyl-CoA dehydrogenase / enoyl-CoA hydratase / 3-hydroxybutyryl-CoA epimerase
MIRSLFISKGELEKGARRPAGVAPQDCKKLGILGAGMMGAGIAYVSARAGIECVLLDTDDRAREQGQGILEGLLQEGVSRGKSRRKRPSRRWR